MSFKNLARKGPKKVWEDGYRNLRVPVAIFDDVKRYLQKTKHGYLATQEGILTDEEVEFIPDDQILSMGTEMQGILQKIIREEFLKFQDKAGYTGSRLPQRKKTSKERVKELLMRYEGEMLTTTQIGEILELPAPTCRQSTREIAEEDDTIEQFPGRPNRYRYNPDLI